jgi:hypothetical protein
MTGEAGFQRPWKPPMAAMAAAIAPLHLTLALLEQIKHGGYGLAGGGGGGGILGGLADLVTRLAGSFSGAGAIGEGQGTQGGSSDRGTTDGSDRVHLTHETFCFRKLDIAFPHEILMFGSANADPEWEAECFGRRS